MIARAQTIAEALRGRRDGGGWLACCPAHDDRDPSLSISDGDNGKVLVHCHAGCSQADVIAALIELGLWQNGERPTSEKRPIIPVPADAPQVSFSIRSTASRRKCGPIT